MHGNEVFVANYASSVTMGSRNERLVRWEKVRSDELLALLEAL